MMFQKILIILIASIITVNSKAELTVMTLNAEWLWTPYDGKVDGSKFNRGDMTKSDYLEEIAFYSAIVRENSVDILAISEIENKFVAKDIARKLGGSWGAYFVQGRDTATGQDVALISRLNLVQGSVTNFDFPCGKATEAKKKKCLSKVIGASFQSNTGDDSIVSVISSHFLSKRNENRSKRLKRESQAHALIKAIETTENRFKDGQESKLVVMGDFNDTYTSTTLNTLREKGRLKGALDCPDPSNKNKKRRVRGIDHVLFRGFRCTSEYTVNTGEFSDHDAVIMKLK